MSLDYSECNVHTPKNEYTILSLSMFFKEIWLFGTYGELRQIQHVLVTDGTALFVGPDIWDIISQVVQINLRKKIEELVGKIVSR